MHTHTRFLAIADELGISSAMLANRGLQVCEEAENLVVAEIGANGRDHCLVAEAAEAWKMMQAAVLRDGATIFIVSAFRSVERQAEIVRGKLDTGITIEEILNVCAPPGYSEHHTGRAVDVSTPGTPSLEDAFDQTLAFDWLMNNANRFGFYLSYPVGNPQGYQYEPWHWCYRENSKSRVA